MERKKKRLILIADDDEDYILILKNAFEHLKIEYELRSVTDGEEFMDYLLRRKKFSCSSDSPRPDLIFMDINMPKKTGFEALKEMRAEPGIGVIPVVILTASNDENDVRLSYRLGANAFMTKPLNFQDLCKDLKTSVQYWLETCVLLAEEGVGF